MSIPLFARSNIFVEANLYMAYCVLLMASNVYCRLSSSTSFLFEEKLFSSLLNMAFNFDFAFHFVFAHGLILTLNLLWN